MRIFLVGYMGSGKSSLAKAIGDIIGFEVIDTDRLVEQRAACSIADIFKNQGENAFRQYEQHVLDDIAEHDFCIVATGGGLPCFGNNMERILALGTVIYLYTEPKILARRLLRSRTVRPLIEGRTPDNLRDYICDTLRAREPFYNRAHLRIDTEHFQMDDLLRSLGFMH